METKKIFLIIIFLCFGLIISGGISYFLGIKEGKSQIDRPVKISEEIFMRAGEAIEIDENLINLKVKVLGGKVGPETGEIETETLKIKIDENTKITFSEDPRLDHSIEAKFEDINVGSLLYIFSSKNIRYEKEFLAEKIIILK